MLSWRHTGFHVHVGGRIRPEDETALGNLAKYIVRASFSQERMVYIPAEKSADGSAKVVYQSKDGGTERTFDAIDWLASLVVHIPNRYEQLVRYLNFYSNKSKGVRKKAETDDIIPSIAPGELTSKQFRRNWARLIRKIYEVDPLCCPNCLHQMSNFLYNHHVIFLSIISGGRRYNPHADHPYSTGMERLVSGGGTRRQSIRRCV